MLHLKHSAPGSSLKNKTRYSRACNLCGQSFVATTPHRCFCEGCKSSSDLYRFHDWLPDAPSEFFEQTITPIKKPHSPAAA
jgi:hypothetical protein